MDPSQAPARVFAVYGHRCPNCGRSDLPLEVHHVNSDKTDNRITKFGPALPGLPPIGDVSPASEPPTSPTPQPDRPLSLVDDFDRRAVAAAHEPIAHLGRRPGIHARQ